jgi:hypothetical protein
MKNLMKIIILNFRYIIIKIKSRTLQLKMQAHFNSKYKHTSTQNASDFISLYEKMLKTELLDDNNQNLGYWTKLGHARENSTGVFLTYQTIEHQWFVNDTVTYKAIKFAAV